MQRFDFDADEVTGDIKRPDGTTVEGAPVIHQPSLIELRWSFQPEILKTLENL